MVSAGALIALDPLRDNSFLTHLATGRLILDRGSVPSTDPYSFTAPNAPWVVQSWLVSVVYATAERLGGLDAVRVVTGSLSAAVAWLGWRLLRSIDGLVPKLAVAALFLAVGAGAWAERPFMVGLIAFAATVMAAEGRLDPRWLLPLGWVWANSHGSFPLGLVFLAVSAVGSRLDGGDPRLELRCLAWASLGALAAVLGPLGLSVLTFPVDLLQRQELLANVVEWQAPTFRTLGERAFLVQVALAVVLLARRPSYRFAVIMAVFVVAALLGSRNIGIASIALLPGMASALSGVGALSADERPRHAVAVHLLALALAGTLIATRLEESAIELRAYPIDVLAYLEEHEVDLREHRMAGPELVGNLLTYVYGADGRRVFFDDRFDMYPSDVSEAQLALVKADRSLLGHLERYGIELVTVRTSHPVAFALGRDPAWRTLFVGERWQLMCVRGSDLGVTIGTC